jgi:dolichol kinase
MRPKDPDSRADAGRFAVPLQPGRVLVHTTFAALPLAYWASGAPRRAMLGLVLALTVPYVLLDAARLVWPPWNRWVATAFSALVRAGEARRLTGATFSLLALLVAVWAFTPPVVAAAFLYHSAGDSAAGWIGRRFGRHRLGSKSLEGAAAFVAVGSAVTWPIVGVWAAFAGAAVAGAAELALPIDDNLSVPLVGGGSLTLLHAVTRGA